MPDTNIIIQAALFAADAHNNKSKSPTGHLRKFTGRPYIEHPLRVMTRTMLVLPSEEYVAAAVLHDTVEDCKVTFEELNESFGPIVATIVRALTNPSKGSDGNRTTRKEIDRKHLMCCPTEVKIIKLIDRIDNVRDMAGGDVGFKRLYAQESILLAEAIGDAHLDLKSELLREIDKYLG
jgi:(p)ppGpp synthase/HD superfamily hydrolase